MALTDSVQIRLVLAIKCYRMKRFPKFPTLVKLRNFNHQGRFLHDNLRMPQNLRKLLNCFTCHSYTVILFYLSVERLAEVLTSAF